MATNHWHVSLNDVASVPAANFKEGTRFETWPGAIDYARRMAADVSDNPKILDWRFIRAQAPIRVGHLVIDVTECWDQHKEVRDG